MRKNLRLPRVEKISFDGAPAWIKRPELTRSSRFVLLHKILEPLTPQVLHRTGAPGGMLAIQQEAQRLQQFEIAALPVPKVLAVCDDSIILSDTGDQLRAMLRRSTDIEEKNALLLRAMHGIKLVHAAGLCHGRPFLKDMTLNAEGKLHFLDLEENPTLKMDLSDAQARDVWLFLSSCTEFCQNPLQDLSALLEIYRSDGQGDISTNLRALGKALRPYRRIITVLGMQNISKDVAGAYWSTKVLEGV